MKEIRTYTMTREDIEKRYGKVQSKRAKFVMLDTFFEERGVNIYNDSSINEYAEGLVYKLRDSKLKSVALNDIEYLKANITQNEDLVKRILATINYYLKVQDDKEAYLNIEKLNKSDEDQKYIDQVYDYYNGNLVENVAEKVIKRKNR